METCLWAVSSKTGDQFPGLLRRLKDDEEGLKLSEISQVLQAHRAPFVVPNFQLHSTSKVATKQPVKAIGPVSKNLQDAIDCTSLLYLILGTKVHVSGPLKLIAFASGYTLVVGLSHRALVFLAHGTLTLYLIGSF